MMGELMLWSIDDSALIWSIRICYRFVRGAGALCNRHESVWWWPANEWGAGGDETDWYTRLCTKATPKHHNIIQTLSSLICLYKIII